jgi:hypothetical protein
MCDHILPDEHTAGPSLAVMLCETHSRRSWLLSLISEVLVVCALSGYTKGNRGKSYLVKAANILNFLHQKVGSEFFPLTPGPVIS